MLRARAGGRGVNSRQAQSSGSLVFSAVSWTAPADSLPVVAQHLRHQGQQHDRLEIERQRLQQQQQQQRPHRALPPPAPDAAGRARQLTAHISRQQHWTLLLNVWLDNAQHYGVPQQTATLCRLARLVEKNGVAAADRPELFKFSGAVLAGVHEMLPSLDARGAAQCLWAYARLQHLARHRCSTGDAAADALVAALLLRGHMASLAPRQLSQVAWAATVLLPLGLSLPSGWWAALQQRLAEVAPAMQAREAACCASAVTKMGHRLAPAAAAALQQHLAAAPAAYGAGELLQVLLALGARHQQEQQQEQEPPQQETQACSSGVSISLPLGSSSSSSTTSSSSTSSSGSGGMARWLQVSCSRLQQLAPCMSARHVSTSLLALARLGLRSSNAAPTHTLPGALSAVLLGQALHTLPSSCPRALSITAYALAKLGLDPGPRWWASYLPFASAALHASGPVDMALQAWGLARLGVQPGPGWTQELLQHSGFKMQGFGAQELAMLLWALGRWRASPALWWWASFEDACHHTLTYFTAAELSALLCGMGSTGPPPPLSAPAALPAHQQQPAAMTALQLQLQLARQLPQGPASRQAAQQEQQQQQQECEEAGTWCRKPYQRVLSPQQQQRRRQQEAQGSHSSAPPPDYIPSGPWTAALLVAMRGALPGAPACTLAGLLMGLARLAIRPSGAWMAAFEGELLAALPRASLKEAAAVLWGCSVLEQQPSGALVRALDARIDALLAATQRRQQQRQWQQRHSMAQARAAVPGAQHAAAAVAAAMVEGQQQQQQQQEQQQQHDWSPLIGTVPMGQSAEAADVTATAAATAGVPAAAAAAAAAGGNGSDGLTPAVAAQLVWSVATLPQPQGVAPWIDCLLGAVQPRLHVGSSGTLLVLLRALAWMQHAPGAPGWLAAWWGAYAARAAPEAAAAAAAAATEAEAAAAGGAGAESNIAGGPGVGVANAQRACPAAEQVCHQLTVVLWCFRRLRATPPASHGWLAAVAQRTQPLLAHVSGQRLCLLLHQVVQLHVWPGEAWVAAAGAALEQRAVRLRPQHVRQAVADLEMLGWQPAEAQALL